jgi:hypothetical protein
VAAGHDLLHCQPVAVHGVALGSRARFHCGRADLPGAELFHCALDIAGCEPKSAPRAEFADIIKSDVALWAKVVREAGITAD